MLNKHRMAAYRCYAALVLSMIAGAAAAARTVEVAPVAQGPFPVACSDVAYDAQRLSQIGGGVSDYWQGLPQNGRQRYFTDILLEPRDTLQIYPIVPNDSSLYPQTWNSPVSFVVIVCYPTSDSNTRPDYALPEAVVVPRMQRAGQKPILPTPLPVPLQPGRDNPNLLPLIILSHGLGGSPLSGNVLDVISRLASFGYIVAAPFHGDARFSVIQINNVNDLLSVVNNFDQFVEMQALRPVALKATVDALLADADFGPRINPQQIGGLGASMGGASMTWLLGASLTDGFVSQHTHATVRDPRIKAAVGYVPYAGETFLPAFGSGNNTAANVNTPYLAICGTADVLAPMYRMEQAMNLFQNSHYMVALSGIPHGYSSAYAGDVFGWAIPFLNAYVKGDAAALSSFLQQKDILGGLTDTLIIDYTAAAPPAGMVQEFYNDQLDHYFITADSSEATGIDQGSAGPGWVRTGNSFKSGGSTAVCRFYGSQSPGPNSHFYTVDTSECAGLKLLQAITPATLKRWNFESLDFFSTPPANGLCPSGTQPVWRAYNNGFSRGVDANHRITTSSAALQQVLARGWINEGVVMCAPTP